MHCGQGNETGGVADTCSTAVNEDPKTERKIPLLVVTPETAAVPKIPRSESYRRIVEAAEDEDIEDHLRLGFFSRFKPTVNFVNIERVPRAKSVKM